MHALAVQLNAEHAVFDAVWVQYTNVITRASWL